MTAYLALFGSAFLAATLVPFYSEVLVIAMLVKRPETWASIWLVASVGNTAGSAANWLLGRYLAHFENHRWFPFKPAQLATGQRWFQKFGVWSLLLAWAPVGGDALTLVAGIMRVRLPVFLLLTFAGKAARYAAIMLLADVSLP